MYALTFSIALGSSRTGLSLRAQLLNGTGGAVGGEVQSGFSEVGGGNYLWSYPDFPDGFTGAVKFYTSDGTVQAVGAVSAEDALAAANLAAGSSGIGIVSGPLLVNSGDVLTAMGLTGSISSSDLAVLTMILPMCCRLIKDYLGYELQGPVSYTHYLPFEDGALDGDPLITGYEGSREGAVPVRWGRDERRHLFLPERPVRSVQAVYENPTAWETDGVNGFWNSTHLLVPGPDYFLDGLEAGISWSGLLVRFGSWAEVRRCVKVQYTAGLTADELASERYSNFKMAALWTVIANFGTFLTHRTNPATGAPAGVVTGEKLDTYQVTFDQKTQQQLYGMNLVMPENAKRLLRKKVRLDQFI